jgi:hypothetical protein
MCAKRTISGYTVSAMDTYFIRHTNELDIDAATRRRIWDDRRIAIHFPRKKDGEPHKRDNQSLELDDFPRREQRAMRALKRLAEDIGYVCAEYFQHSECVKGIDVLSDLGRFERGTK